MVIVVHRTHNLSVGRLYTDRQTDKYDLKSPAFSLRTVTNSFTRRARNEAVPSACQAPIRF